MGKPLVRRNHEVVGIVATRSMALSVVNGAALCSVPNSKRKLAAVPVSSGTPPCSGKRWRWEEGGRILFFFICSHW